jgi:hypothetical protein
MADNTHCYTAACKSCGEVLAVTVADAADYQQMKRALVDCAGWENDGMMIGNCIVSDVHAGKFNFEHKAGCSG